MEKVKFEKLFYENDCNMYKRGRFLLKKYSDIPKEVITSHNNIPSLRAYENKQFPKLKNYLILGKRKTHKYVINHKISNFLVPFTSSGCYAMCQYCYLVCNYNKCSYLRVFVNKEEILDHLIKTSQKYEKNTVYEIGSNSDLLLENEVTEEKLNDSEFLRKAKQLGFSNKRLADLAGQTEEYVKNLAKDCDTIHVISVD